MADETTTEITGYSGHRHMSLDEIAAIQPGLARIMPDIGIRTWKMYYAAKASNWPLANFQLKEIKELMEFGQFTRPKYEGDLEEFMTQQLAVLERAIRAQDFEAFHAGFQAAIEQANAYHEKHDKAFLRWKLPDMPPLDLDVNPR